MTAIPPPSCDFQNENIPLADDDPLGEFYVTEVYQRQSAELLTVDRPIDVPPLWIGRRSLPENDLFYDFWETLLLPRESKSYEATTPTVTVFFFLSFLKLDGPYLLTIRKVSLKSRRIVLTTV